MLTLANLLLVVLHYSVLGAAVVDVRHQRAPRNRGRRHERADGGRGHRMRDGQVRCAAAQLRAHGFMHWLRTAHA